MLRKIWLGILNRIRIYYPRITNIIFEVNNFIFNCRRILIIDAFLEQRYGRIIKFNWGDDINFNVFSILTGKKIIIYRTSFFPRLLHLKKYCLIGSCIGLNVDNKTVIWGSGIDIGFDKSLMKQPLKVCAVRGPLSRKFLIDCGIACPEIYGDPALLLPYVYKTQNIVKQYKVGVIPHFVEKNERLIKEIADNPSDYHVIDLRNYDKWTDIIDDICKCDFIISSSLHGLIVSDAYGIPNQFVYFGKINTSENFFKYRDYAASVGKEFNRPLLLTEYTQFLDLIENHEEYIPIQIDLKPLIAACPFNIDIHE